MPNVALARLRGTLSPPSLTLSHTIREMPTTRTNTTNESKEKQPGDSDSVYKLSFEILR